MGFHKLVIQPEFCDIFIFNIIYSSYSIWKQMFTFFFRFKFEVGLCSFSFSCLINKPEAFPIVFKSQNDLPKGQC